MYQNVIRRLGSSLILPDYHLHCLSSPGSGNRKFQHIFGSMRQWLHRVSFHWLIHNHIRCPTDPYRLIVSSQEYHEVGTFESRAQELASRSFKLVESNDRDMEFAIRSALTTIPGGDLSNRKNCTWKEQTSIVHQVNLEDQIAKVKDS